MVRYKPGHKEQTRNRIVDAASEVFKSEGVSGARIEDVMKTVGLTVGGFYRHYESKDDLLCDALSRAIADSRKNIEASSRVAEGAQWLKLAAANYLSTQHRDDVAHGCALPALSADVARSSTKVRKHFEGELKSLVGEIASHLEGSPEERDRKAWQMSATMVGGILLARAVADARLSEKILADCRALYDYEHQ